MDATIKVLLASILIAPIWTLFESLVLGVAERCIGQDSGEAAKKMASAVTTACSHSLQLVMWWYVVLNGELTGWVFDYSGWAAIMLPRPQDIAERDMLTPYYMIYFGFAWHSLVKDLRRSWGNLKSPEQFSFLLHHILAVVLVAGAFKVGCWRAGVLTRLIHDPADIFLYGSKCYQSFVDQGRGRRIVLVFLYILNNIVWSGTRVFLYGYFMLCLNDLLELVWADASIGTFTRIVCSALWLGSAIMWLLQVIWFGALVAATRKFIYKGEIERKDIIDVGQSEEKTPLTQP